ncbi:phosphomannomutase/phosphoglucomutase [Fundicoccus sp. Sow4_H7]|uniref:phosphomannomutase/phosphoglucomutase n=1 Tax=Fundicoccus sp. Sow4_H7 TaxID=3438784 RepID=UPI003F8F64C0
MTLEKLINGSDIRGVAIKTEGLDQTLTLESVRKIAHGFIYFLKEEKNLKHVPLKVAIGIDSRVSGPEIKTALTETFVKLGVHVLDAGMATTPAMFMATQYDEFAADGSIMVTASHLPFMYNGLKFFTKAGGAEHEDMDFIVQHTDATIEVNEEGKVDSINLVQRYADDLVGKIRKDSNSQEPLKDMHIVLDAGNGAGGFFAKDVLEVLGANTNGSQFLDPDGNFPNHVPNPDNKEAMASIQKAVLDNQADLGIIFDTDVDRAAVVDSTGEVINRNNLIAVLAHIILQDEKDATIVTNSPTSSHLKTFINELGGQQYRFISGYRNVINKAIELNNAGIHTPLAIETSGHAAFKENYFLDDGAYVVAKILMFLPKLQKENLKLSDLITTLQQPAETQELRFHINEENFKKYGQKVIEEMNDFVDRSEGFTLEEDNREGIRVNVSAPFASGWFLLRLSLHEPLLVLQLENDVEGSNHKVISHLRIFFEQYKSLDLGKLETYLKKLIKAIK